MRISLLWEKIFYKGNRNLPVVICKKSIYTYRYGINKLLKR